jgi:hypothetical protein
MTWKIKAKGAKQTTEVISDDPKYAIFKANQWRSHGLEVWIEDINGNKVDEAALRKAADQTYPHVPPLNYQFHWSDYGFRKSSGRLKEEQPMARKKNAAEIKEPDEYRGLVRLAMLDFRGRHQRKPHDFEEFWEWCHRYGSDEVFREADSQVRPPGYLLLAK